MICQRAAKLWAIRRTGKTSWKTEYSSSVDSFLRLMKENTKYKSSCSVLFRLDHKQVTEYIDSSCSTSDSQLGAARSNIFRDTDNLYSAFSWSCQSRQAYSRIVLQIRPRPLPPTSFPTHYHPIIRLYMSLLTVSLNKLQINTIQDITDSRQVSNGRGCWCVSFVILLFAFLSHRSFSCLLISLISHTR
jgi:hypothetical protein